MCVQFRRIDWASKLALGLTSSPLPNLNCPVNHPVKTKLAALSPSSPAASERASQELAVVGAVPASLSQDSGSGVTSLHPAYAGMRPVRTCYSHSFIAPVIR